MGREEGWRIMLKKLLQKKIEERSLVIGIIGLGYAGLPQVLRFAEAGFRVIGFDIDEAKVESLNKGVSYISHISSQNIKNLLERRVFEATSSFDKLGEVDAIIISVPTPLNRHREPDLTYLFNTADVIFQNLKAGHIISLESTTYPGTTEEELLPRFSKNGLEVGKDFFLIYSPEREDPGNTKYNQKDIPKVLGGVTEDCRELGISLYKTIVNRVIPLSSPGVAEMTKLLENIYRVVNIALVNELKILCDKMGISIWEVIEAAATKPFGFQAFYPGPGLGGHCIPIDPFYLTWKAREYDFPARFIELAGEINTSMPYYVVEKTIEALNNRGKSIKGSKILILGVAYKRDVGDDRESPAYAIMDQLIKRGAEILYNDPYIPYIKKSRKYDFGLRFIPLSKELLKEVDAVLLITDHSDYDYEWILENSNLIIDTRGVFKGIFSKIVRA